MGQISILFLLLWHMKKNLSLLCYSCSKSLILIMGKQQTKPNWRLFYKITTLYSSDISRLWKYLHPPKKKKKDWGIIIKGKERHMIATHDWWTSPGLMRQQHFPPFCDKGHLEDNWQKFSKVYQQDNSINANSIHFVYWIIAAFENILLFPRNTHSGIYRSMGIRSVTYS